MGMCGCSHVTTLAFCIQENRTLRPRKRERVGGLCPAVEVPTQATRRPSILEYVNWTGKAASLRLLRRSKAPP
jgi:hypothetical protein